MNLRVTVILICAGVGASPALGAPTISIVPTSGARFAIDQRFDVRIEVAPTPDASLTKLTLFLDGVVQSIDHSALKDGGVNLRRRSYSRPGTHTIRVTASDAAGSSEATSRFEIVRVGQASRTGPQGQIRNLIILLGDGMGISHRTAARIVRYGTEGGYTRGKLAMDTMPGTGFVMTASLNSIVTDSSPGMSNYVTGNKAANNQEGVFPDTTPNAFDNPRIEYLSEYLHRKRGTVLGIVTTADVEDATPAANAVHTSDRNAGTGICDQYLDERGRTGLSVLMGGGRRWFLPSGQFGSSRDEKTDYVLPLELATAYELKTAGAIDPERNLLKQFKDAGFFSVSTKSQLEDVPQDAEKLLGLFAFGNMNTAYDKVAERGNPEVVSAYHAPDQPMLDEMTKVALRVLKRNRNGFVLMVEGAHIDKQSHMMDAERAIWETIEFDRAVAVALKFAREDGNTLVIVTADHECSGFSIVGASTKTTAELEALPSDVPSSTPADHPARQAAVGVYDSAAFPHYTIALDGYPVTPGAADFKGLQVGFGAGADRFEDWLHQPRPVIDSLLPEGIKKELGEAGYAKKPMDRRPENERGFFLRGNVKGEQAVHTGSDVPISSYSSGSEAWRAFVGVMDNTDVFFKLVDAATRPAPRH